MVNSLFWSCVWFSSLLLFPQRASVIVTNCQKSLFFFPEVIKEKGLEHVTVEDLVVDITPKGRGTSIYMYMFSSFLKTSSQFSSQQGGAHIKWNFLTRPYQLCLYVYLFQIWSVYCCSIVTKAWTFQSIPPIKIDRIYPFQFWVQVMWLHSRGSTCPTFATM